VYGFVGYLTFIGELSLSDFFVITLSFRLLSKVLGDIKNHLREYSKEIVHLEKLRDVMEHGPKLSGIDTGEKFTSGTKDITIKDMSF
jgi:hypothetical protein